MASCAESFDSDRLLPAREVITGMIGNRSIARRAGPVIVLCALLCCASPKIRAAENLDCPEIGSGHVPDLIGDARGGGLFATENFIDLANEINDAIGRLEVSNPDISSANVQDVLIAAYCRVLARDAGLSATEKWGRMRQFTGVLEREIAATSPPARTLITARVPLRAEVYRELQAQAAVSHQTAAQLMAAILARAAGR